MLSRYAPQSNGQRMGVRLARRVIHDIRHRNGPRGNPGMDGVRRPSLTDFIIAAMEYDPHTAFTCAELIDRLSPYVRLDPDRRSSAHRIHAAINRDTRFRRHEHGIYTVIHHE